MILFVILKKKESNFNIASADMEMQGIQDGFINEVVIEETSIGADDCNYINDHDVNCDINPVNVADEALGYSLLQGEFLTDGSNSECCFSTVPAIDETLTIPYCEDDIELEIEHQDLDVNGTILQEVTAPDCEEKPDIPCVKDIFDSAEVETVHENEINLPIDHQDHVDLELNEDASLLLVGENCVTLDEETSSHVCDICRKSFKRKSYLTRHKRVHSEKKKFVCDVCEQGFISNAILSKHRRTHTEERPFVCDICQRSFRAQSGLAYHLRSHSDDNGYHPCAVCDKLFSLKSSLSQHIRTVHRKERSYLCDTCGLSFHKLSTLKKHSICHVPEHFMNYPFNCNVCNKSFRDKYTLKVHMKLHEGIKEFLCTHCDKSFTYKHALNCHLRTHTGARPYSCEHCEKCFTQSSSLKVHRQRHH